MKFKFIVWPGVAFCLLGGLPSVLDTAFSQEKTTPETPVVAAASDEGKNALAGFKIPSNWKSDLFAAEPEIANPVAFYVDHLGRLFVCESFRQNQGVTDNRGHDQTWLMADLQAQSVQDRINYHRRLLPDQGKNYTEKDDRIRMLVDKDGDGKVDQSVVFASGFNQLEDGTGAGVLVRGNTAYYTCIPKVWELTDRDADGVAEDRKVMSDGYGVRVAFRGHDMHGLVIGPDGRLYFSIGDRGYHVQTPNGLLHDPASGAVFRCELDGSNLEVFATGLRNPQELAFDDYGRLFTGDNNSDSGDKARWVYIVRGGDTGWRMYYQYHKVRGPFNRESIWKPYSEKSPAYIVPPVDNIADGPSGLTYYPGTGLNEAFRNTFFLCDFRGQASNSGIRAIKLKEKGAFFEIASNEQLIWNLLATDADFGPDGALYVSDWVNGWNGEGKGRIYKFFDPQQQNSAEAKSARELLAEGASGKSSEALAKWLTHPDRRVRFEAQWELAKQKQLAVLSNHAGQTQLATPIRLHGLWGLGQLVRQGSQEAAAKLKALLQDQDPWIVATAIQVIADSKSHVADA
ncbi:MAG: PVC-type heme-binding CxxCH protein [Pirellulales bacterium]